MTFDRSSTLGEIYDHPVGRDAIDRILLQMDKPRSLVDNPVVRRIRLGLLEQLVHRFTGREFFAAFTALLNGVADRPSGSDGPDQHPWWRSAVFYQVYPRSFADSDGDGVGDLRGIIQRLDHLAELGVDCLWLSPIFESPLEDMGYDISDYRAVNPEMGTMRHLDELIAACHERGMRIILDLVVNHTSDQHEWFVQAREDPEGRYGQYYYFRQGSPEQPPNNWVSFFSGSAWRWLDDAQRWVLRLFAPGQPDLNWENPVVRGEVAELVQWWLARGIDGFRLDVINYVSKHPGLPDGDDFVGRLTHYTGIERYFHGPRLHEFLRELRQDGFVRPDGDWPGGPGKDPVGVMIGETPGIGIEGARLLTGWDRKEMDLTFTFDHLMSPGHTRWTDPVYDLEYLKKHFIDYTQRITGNDWIAVFWENHDNPRMVAKVDPRPQFRTPVAKVLGTILLTLRGTPFIYQGQEIAATNQNFRSIDDFRDIESLNRYAEYSESDEDPWQSLIVGSRDHARTPMRWDVGPNQGFTTGEPWIGFHENSAGYTVEEQLADPESVLHWYKQLIRLRRAHPALSVGGIRFVQPQLRHYFAYFRELGDERWFIEMNLGATPLKRPRREAECVVEMGTTPESAARMEPFEVLVCRVVR